ERQ
ncbi:3-oxoacyl-(Acyl carrier) reductase domain protein, partial [Vibrio harveyi]